MLKGILAVAASSIAYGVMPVFAKIVLGRGLSAAGLVFYRFLLACFFAAAVMKMTRTPFRVERRQFVELFLYGTAGFGMTTTLLTSSYQFIPTGLATMFHFSYPLFVTAAMVVLFRERITLFKVLSVAAALGGIMLMADFSAGLAVNGVVLALLSGVTYALFVVASRKSSFASVPALTVIFYVTLFSSAVFGIKAAVSGELAIPPDLPSWLSLVAISLFCTVFALCMLTVGIRLLGASKASVLNMIEPVTSVVCGILFFQEALTLKSGGGCALILLSTALVVLEGRFSRRTRKDRET